MSVANCDYGESPESASLVLGLQWVVELWAPSRRAVPLFYCILCGVATRSWESHCSLLRHALLYVSHQYPPALLDTLFKQAKTEDDFKHKFNTARKTAWLSLHPLPFFLYEGVPGFRSSWLRVAWGASVGSSSRRPRPIASLSPSTIASLANWVGLSHIPYTRNLSSVLDAQPWMREWRLALPRSGRRARRRSRRGPPMTACPSRTSATSAGPTASAAPLHPTCSSHSALPFSLF